MPFALIIAGLILTISGARGTQSDLFTLLKGDFTGDKSFIWWAISILGIGAVGYIKPLKPLSNVFLALVLVVLVLANSKDGKGLFSKFNDAIKSGTKTDDNAANDNGIFPLAQAASIGGS